MITQKKFFTLALLSVIGFSCSKKDDSVNYPSSTVNDRVNRDIPLGSQKIVVIENAIGSVILTGNGQDGTLFSFMDNNCTAGSYDDAQRGVAQIELSTINSGDTLILSITSPLNSADRSFSSGLSLDLPYFLPCVLRSIGGDISVDSYGGNLFIAKGTNVELNRYQGSCSITATKNVTALLAVNAIDTSSIESSGGSISISIPTSLSAFIVATTQSGKVTTSNLTFATSNSTSRSFSGTLGGGGGLITLKTVSGNISLNGVN